MELRCFGGTFVPLAQPPPSLLAFRVGKTRRLRALTGCAVRSKRGGKSGGTASKDRIPEDGVEFAVEHGGKGQFEGLRILSAGAAKALPH